MKRYTYTVLLFRDPHEPDTWLGAVPAVRGVHSSGDTREEALAMTTDALEGMLEVLIELGERFPDDVTDLEPAREWWRDVLKHDEVEFSEAQVTVRAEVMEVAA